MILGANIPISDTPVKIIDDSDFAGGPYTVVLRVDSLSTSAFVYIGHSGMTVNGGLVLFGADGPLSLTISGGDLYAATDNTAASVPLSVLAYSY